MNDNKLPVWQLMSEAMRAVVDKSNELAPGAYDVGDDLPAMRAAYDAERRYWNEGGPVMASSRDAEMGTNDGPVKIRFHVPLADATSADGALNRPVIVYIHGGGFILGNLDTHDRIMRTLAHETGAPVIGVDYALSPEAKFPTALHQCAAIVAHLRAYASFYGIDPDRISLAGDSGGANLALGTYLYLRDHDGAAYIASLLLYYGMFGLRDSASRRLLGGSWDGLTEDDLKYYQDAYLADAADARSPYVDNLGADLRGLPPTFIAAAELDPLRDDSAALAIMMQTHNLHFRHVVYPGVIHGFLHNSRLLDTAILALRDGASYFSDAAKWAALVSQN